MQRRDPATVPAQRPGGDVEIEGYHKLSGRPVTYKIQNRLAIIRHPPLPWSHGDRAAARPDRAIR